MAEKSNFKQIDLAGEAYMSVICGKDPDGRLEVQHVETVQMMFSDGNVKIYIDLHGLRYPNGLTVMQSVAERYEELQMLAEQQAERDRKEAREAAVNK